MEEIRRNKFEITNLKGFKYDRPSEIIFESILDVFMVILIGFSLILGASELISNGETILFSSFDISLYHILALILLKLDSFYFVQLEFC